MGLKRGVLVVLGMLLFGASCGRSSPSGGGAGGLGAGAQAIPKGVPAELLQVVEHCPPKGQTLEIYNCYDLGPWQRSTLVTGPGGDEERLELLGDRRPVVRALVAQAFETRPCPSEQLCAYAARRELAERLLDRAEAERDERVAVYLARPIARIDLDQTGLKTRVERYVETAPEQVSVPLLDLWLQYNESELSTLARLADSSKPAVRKAALAGLRHALRGPDQAEACRVYIEKFGQGSEYDWLATTILLGDRGKDCLFAWDAFLSKAEERRRSGFLGLGPAPNWFHRLLDTAREAQLTDVQKERMLAFAVSVSEDTALDPKLRRSALFFAAPSHPYPDAYLEPLTRDTDPEIRAKAAWWWDLERRRANRKPYAGFRSTRPIVQPSAERTAAAPQGLPRAPAQPTFGNGPAARGSEEQEARGVPWKLIVALPLAAALAALVGVHLRKRLRRPDPDRGTPRAAVPPPDPTGADGPTGPKRLRPPCAVHGIATGPDGLCALCRSAEPRAHDAARSAGQARSVAMAGGFVLVVALLWVAALVAGGSAPSPGLTRSPAGRFASSPDQPEAATQGLAYVDDTHRSQAREPGGTFLGGSMRMISSPVIRAGGGIPLKYTCDGANVSPPLTFDSVPINARSLSLQMKTHKVYRERPRDAPRTPPGRDEAAYWTLINLPPNLAGLPEGVTELPPGVVSPPGPNGKIGYSGPCPVGDEVSYEFWLYAFDIVLPDPGPGGHVELLSKEHLLAVEIENGQARYPGQLKISVPDLPDELRNKEFAIHVCDPRGQPCRLERGDGHGYGGSAVYRNDELGIWFTDLGDRYGVAAVRFEVNLQSDSCKRTGTLSTCSFPYSELRTH